MGLLGTFCFSFCGSVVGLLVGLNTFLTIFLTNRHRKSRLPVQVGKAASNKL